MAQHQRHWHRVPSWTTPCLLAAVAAAAGCGAPKTPTAPTSTSVTRPSPVGGTFRLHGVVTDDAGAPIPNARVGINFGTVVGSGVYFSEVFATSGADGSYTTDFVTTVGAMRGPAGTETAVAFTWTSAPGYDDDYRYVLASDNAPTESVALKKITRITAGESVPVTVDANAPICDNNIQDFHPWSTEFICRSVHVIAPQDGTITATVSSASGATAPALEIEIIGTAPGSCCEPLGNSLSLSVAAGTELDVNIELPWRSPTDASIVLKTSFAAK